MLLEILLVGSLIASPAATRTDIAERIKPDLDAFVFCVLDESVARLDVLQKPEDVAELAAYACETRLKKLEDSLARAYREEHAHMWAAGQVEATAASNAAVYRRLVITSAIRIITERRSPVEHSNSSLEPSPRDAS